MRIRSITALSILFVTLFSACGDDDQPPPPATCTKPEDCPMGQQCAPDGKCVAGAECVSDEPCVAQDPRKVCNLQTLKCELRPGFGDECDEDRPCAFGQFCSQLLGRCLDSGAARDCTRRGQCPAGQTCDKSANKCVQDLGCFGVEYCEEGELCDLVTHTCRQVSIECTRCTAEGACSGGARCVMESRECVPPGADEACRTGELCDPLGRCVQCINSDQCGPGTFCNPSVGRCESNVQCADDPNDCPNVAGVECVVCRAPQVCDRRSHRCQAPPMLCEDDTSCPGDQFCDRDQDPPICVPRIPDCLPDLLEPNNSSGSPRLLDPRTGPLYDELQLCPSDADWYRLEIEAGTYLTIDARFRQTDGDIDLQLFLADGRTLVDESRSITDNERVELEVGTDLVLLVRVFLAVPAINPVPYKLVVSRDMGNVCADDSHEPDDLIGQAMTIEADVPFEGRVCSADPDWFVIRNVPPSTHITADLDFTSSLGDLELELYRASSAAPIQRASTVTDDEHLEYDASFGGDYYFRVFGKQADANVYTLRVGLAPSPGAVCLDDPYEPNNARVEATSLMTTNEPSLSICSGDEDWYLVHLLSGEAVSAEIGFEPSADLELKLYGPGANASTPIRVSNGVTGREHLARRVFDTGDYYLRVHGISGSDASPYELFLEKYEPLLCLPDRIDMMMTGNDMMTAFDMGFPPARLDKLTYCFGDSDWYRAFLLGGYTNVIQLHFIEDDANLELAVYDGTGRQLVQTDATGVDTKELLANVPGQGVAVVFLEVINNGGFESVYDLTVDLVPLYTCEADAAEPNETPAQASMVTSSTVSPVVVEDLSLCTTNVSPLGGGGDEDWFVLRPPRAGARITATLEHQQGDLFLELVSPGPGRRACVNFGPDRCYSDGYDLEEMVTFTATTTNPYYLRVGSIYSSAEVPVRPLSTDSPYRLEIDYQ
jgi:hypothetical protein